MIAPQFGSLNHRHPGKRNAAGPAPASALSGGEADINQPTTLAESVENDP